MYRDGASSWWGEVIFRTGVGAGVGREEMERFGGEIVKTLIKRFSTKEGYEAFEGAISTCALFFLALWVRIY